MDFIELCNGRASISDPFRKSTKSRIAFSINGDPALKRKILMQIKMIAILLTGFMCHVSASTVSQTVTISGSNLKLETVLAAIERQTGYTALYNEADIKNAGLVSVSFRDLPLKAFLDAVFTEQPLDYTIRKTTIFIRTKPVTTEKMVEPVFILPPVKGRVADSTGKGLAGVSITASRGKSNLGIVLTDGSGNFNLGIELQKGDKLYFSSVGFESQMITLDDPTATLNVVLKVVVRDLSDFEVTTINTGYQRIRPEQSTGAVSQISTKEYEARISTNFLDGLVNRMPGLMINNDVTFTSGGTSRALFNIRGISTMTATQTPLIVIDGYPTELTMDMIDPNEIKSVTILKDAAASTVYGVRASNGVIVIERKQAKIGKPVFNFRATVGITPKENYSRYRWEDDMSSILVNYQRRLSSASITAANWAQLATNVAGTGGAANRQQTYYIMAQAAANMITADQATKAFAELENYNNTEEYGDLFLRNAATQTYNFNVSGGNDKALYYLTANYTGNRLSRIKNSNDRFMLSGRTTVKFSPKLSLELTTDYQERFNNNAPVPDISAIAPYERFRDVNGNSNPIIGMGISPWFNNIMVSQGLYDQLYYPLVDANEITDKGHTVNNRITANFNYSLGRGLDLSFGGIYETSNSSLDYHASELSSVARRYVNNYVSRSTDNTLKYNIPKGGYLRQTSAKTHSYTARAQLNYNKKIGLHSFNGILGTEVRNVVNKSNTASYFGYNNETLLQQPVDFASIVNGTIRGSFITSSPFQGSLAYRGLFDQQYVEDRFLSGYANLVYSYRNTYSLTGSIRIDQSNLFGTNPKYKYKPLWSVGAAWNIHNEGFMQDLNWVNQFKLRVAYGFNGNVAKNSLPQAIAEAYINPYTSPASSSLRGISLANSSLRWEQTQNFNAGLDYTIFKNVSGSIDYYNKRSTDLLGNALIDPTIGPSPSLINRATINNKGLELALRADWIATKKFNWNTGLVISRNISKTLEVYQRGDYNPQTLNAIGFVKSYPVGALFAYRWAGLDNEGYPLLQDEEGKTFRTNVNTSGNPMFALMASDTSGFTYYKGSSIPTINAGLSNRVDIGSFYIFAMINYYGGFKVRVPRANPSSFRMLEGSGSYWKEAGDELTTDVMGLAAYNSRNSNDAYNNADKYVVDGDYFTLGDLTVSYSLDKMPFIKRTGFSNFEIKAQASNLLTVGVNKYNYSMATGSFQKTYLTPTYTIGVFTNF